MCVRSGTSAKIAFRLTSLCAFLLSCCGKALRCGSSVQVLETHHALSSKELARIQSHDVLLPTTTHGQIRLRCVTQPDDEQAALLDRLGIVMPKRMRLEERQLPALPTSALAESRKAKCSADFRLRY